VTGAEIRLVCGASRPHSAALHVVQCRGESYRRMIVGRERARVVLLD
jgi:hypothetical protein